MATDKLSEATAAVAVPVARLREVLEDPTVPYQRIVVSLAVSVFFFETYIKSALSPALPRSQSTLTRRGRLRQIPHLRRTEAPKELARYLDDGDAQKDEAAKRQEFLRAQAYALDKLKFGLFAKAVDLVETLFLVSPILAPLFATSSSSSSGSWSGYSSLWSLSERLSAAWASKAPGWINFGTGEVPTSLMFLTLMTAVGSVTGLPADLWKQFVLEEKHGFNKQTLKLWCLDQVLPLAFFVYESPRADGHVQVKVLALNAVLGLPICAALIALVRWAGEDFVQWTMLFVCAPSLSSPCEI